MKNLDELRGEGRGTCGAGEVLDLCRVLVELRAEQQVLEAVRLLGHGEQRLPLVERQLVGVGLAVLEPFEAHSVLAAALLLPGGDLLPLAHELALVVVVVALLVVEVVDRVHRGIPAGLKHLLVGHAQRLVARRDLLRVRREVVLREAVHEHRVIEHNTDLLQQVAVVDAVLDELLGGDAVRVRRAEGHELGAEAERAQVRRARGAAQRNIINEQKRLRVLLVHVPQIVEDVRVVDRADRAAEVPALNVLVGTDLHELRNHRAHVLLGLLRAQLRATALDHVVRQREALRDVHLAVLALLRARTEQNAAGRRRERTVQVARDLENHRGVQLD